MASEIQICNEALAFIGVPAILSRADNSKPARQCNLIFDDKRDELLRNFEWKFATKRVNLAPTTTTPDFGWTYEFNIPADCEKVLFVGTSDEIEIPYSLEGNKILANYDLIYVKYTQRIMDPNKMDSLFRATLAMYLTQYICTPLGKKSEYNKCVEEYESKLSDARFAGSIEMYDDKMEAEDWLQSRY